MRVSEIYLSIQGEGPRVGIPTVFVRFAGCNLRCSSWPCDTPHAIFPELYRKEWLDRSPGEVLEMIFSAAGACASYNVCFTGGEPFLQKAEEMDELINLLLHNGDQQAIECFSNGTLPYTELAIDNVSFVMDWKLPGSGEAFDNKNRGANFLKLHYKDSVKFTISDWEDYGIAKDIWETAKDVNPFVSWYVGVVWGKLTDKELIEWILEDGPPWRHTMQVHNLIWDRTQRGI